MLLQIAVNLQPLHTGDSVWTVDLDIHVPVWKSELYIRGSVDFLRFPFQ